MKKICLYTLTGNGNFGNKLQHYALQYYLKNKCFKVESIMFYNRHLVLYKLREFVKYFLKQKFKKFYEFDKKINYSKNYIFNDIQFNNEKYDYYIVGSDQVWNVTFPSYSNKYLLDNIDSKNKISYAASFGINKLPDEYKTNFKNELNKFKSISVREDSGKKIIEELTGRTDVEVLIDPTMLLTTEEWDKVSNKPKNFDKLNGKKYILNYFLGKISDARKKEIERIAKDNNCEIINLLDKNDPFYISGPSEFLYLEKNAFLICTDSFHSSVFALLYNRPFVIFDREDNEQNMSSRLDTLINKFKLKSRKFNGKITKENLEHDYTEAYRILEKERNNSKKFLEKALDIKVSETNDSKK